MHPFLAFLVRLASGRAPPEDKRSRGRDAAETGRRGERRAARALKRRGYRIVARRWRTPVGEVDLLAIDGDTVVVVEVKSSRSRDSTPLAARIDRKKRRRLQAVLRYVRTLDPFRGRRARIDLVFVRWHDHGIDITVRRDVFRGQR